MSSAELALVNTATDLVARDGQSTAPVPQSETLTTTKRQRLFHCVKLNAARFDHQLRPMLAEADTLPVGERAAMRVLFTLAQRTLKIDFQEHPHALFLLLLHVIPDDVFARLWADLEPLVRWCGQGE
jgi:hypothetical protein